MIVNSNLADIRTELAGLIAGLAELNRMLDKAANRERIYMLSNPGAVEGGENESQT